MIKKKTGTHIFDATDRHFDFFTTDVPLNVFILHRLGSKFLAHLSTKCSSGLRESSHWLSKANKKGEIFVLELRDSAESQEVSNSDKDCFCVCSDCATDDTGYGTDTDLYASIRKSEVGDADSLCQSSRVLSEISLTGDLVTQNNVKLHRADNISLELGNVSVKAEEDIDSLFRSVNLSSPGSDLNCEANLLSVADLFSSDVDNVLTTSWASLKSCNTKENDKASAFSMSEATDLMNTSINGELPTFGKINKKLKPQGKCECTLKNQRILKGEYVINLKLRPQHTNLTGCSTVEFCEHVLGIVPGHYGSNQGAGQHHRRRDRRIKIRGILPNGIAAKWPDIHVGDCLVSVNDQEVTWDNLKQVLQVLQYQRQAKLVLKRSSKQKDGSSLVVKKQSSSSRLVQLVTGANISTANIEDLITGPWEPFYGAMYLSLDGVNSDNMHAKEDIVYQFPRVDNKVIDSRGMFITLAGTLTDATQSTVQSTTLMVDGSPVHIVYHYEGQNLFVVSAPEHRFSKNYLTSVVEDLVRVLEVTHGSIQEAFSGKSNHQQLDCFFALFHQNQFHALTNGTIGSSDSYSVSQSVKVLPLPNDIKMCFDSVLSEFEAADFGDMGDSYYGCRRSYSILGSCLFYKNYLISNHLPKDDLIDFATYLRYHALLTLTSDLSIGQLVSWKEVHPTRTCRSVPPEQSFGYTEPLIAKWYWLIVGYKNMMMCIMLEKGGCTAVDEGSSSPDPFLIDQARAALMQIDSQNLPKYCQNSITSPMGPLLCKPDMVHQKQQAGDLLSKTLKKLPHRENLQPSLSGSINENHGALRRVFQRRKDSIGSDNSSESSGDSVFKFSRGGRLYPENADILQNISENREEYRNTCSKLTVGADNCLFHFQYYDNLEGVCITSEANRDYSSQLNTDVYNNFKQACLTINNLFDDARKVKEQTKDAKDHIVGLNDDFTCVREEGIMFTCESPINDKKQTPLCYWVVGRCLSRSQRREVYVCFHESIPQTVIEMAFKMATGYLPV